MKLQPILTIAFLTLSIATFSSFSILHQNADLINFVVTVESNDAFKSVSFNIAISEHKGEMTDFKLLENQRTPFKIELHNADYLIVIHKTDDKGIVTSQVEQRSNGEPKVTASTGGSVMVFTTEKDGKVTCFGMD